jgi:hypothetical protein
MIAAAFALDAAPASANPELQSSGREMWTGSDVSSNVWLAYSGVTFAPWSGMHDDGFRFRAAGGYGEYQYSRTPEDGDLRDPGRATQFHAETYFADFLVGYQKRFGELIAKGLVGVSTISHDISPTDEETIAIGDEIGIKGVIELWLNIGQDAWGSLDLSWASAHNTRAARGRLGYRVWPDLSIGLEAGLNLDSQGQCRIEAEANGDCGYLDKDTGKRKFEQADMLDYARAGIFVRYEWDVSEASISGGVLGDSFSGDDDVEIAPYMTFNWLTQF